MMRCYEALSLAIWATLGVKLPLNRLIIYPCAAVAMGVESANVVGYQEIAVPAGSSMRTATFKAISGDYKISDIKVEGAVGAGNEYGQLINSDGTWGNTYF